MTSQSSAIPMVSAANHTINSLTVKLLIDFIKQNDVSVNELPGLIRATKSALARKNGAWVKTSAPQPAAQPTLILMPAKVEAAPPPAQPLAARTLRRSPSRPSSRSQQTLLPLDAPIMRQVERPTVSYVPKNDPVIPAIGPDATPAPVSALDNVSQPQVTIIPAVKRRAKKYRPIEEQIIASTPFIGESFLVRMPPKPVDNAEIKPIARAPQDFDDIFRSNPTVESLFGRSSTPASRPKEELPSIESLFGPRKKTLVEDVEAEPEAPFAPAKPIHTMTTSSKGKRVQVVIQPKRPRVQAPSFRVFERPAPDTRGTPEKSTLTVNFKRMLAE